MLRYYPKRTGSAFTSANTETWNYNAKGEVVTANSSNNTFDRSYEFDGIGNRKKSADSIMLPAVDNYVANTLNQLTSANSGARIHDADGNLTDDGEKLFVWDAENRLIEIKLKSDNSTVATYGYDYKSRRITKTVGATETNFVYDGWNPIAEFTGTTLSKSYTWGMDLSGSMQGAGGVGGLLSVNDGNNTYYPTFDGNGNVSEYVDTTGVVVAHYEYDAFGQVVASGTMKDDFTHQFSTKQLDSESGLHYYGYRYYDSSNGRWPSRDPIQENGSFNVYNFVGNDSVRMIDLLGQLEINADAYEIVRSRHDDHSDDWHKNNTVIGEITVRLKTAGECGSEENCKGELTLTIEFEWRNTDPNDPMSRIDTTGKDFFQLNARRPIAFGGVPNIDELSKPRSSPINGFSDKTIKSAGYKGEIEIGKIDCCGGWLMGALTTSANYGTGDGDLNFHTIKYKISVKKCGTVADESELSIESHKDGPGSKIITK